MAVTVDGVKKEEMPTSPVGKDGKYYDVQVNCTSSKTSGLWDYNAWRLNLDYIESNSKCNLEFTSTMSKADYDKYIQAGVALRRSTYRGKDITDYFKGTKKFNDKDLYQQISNGTFDDIYVGDYIQGSSGVTWLIADLDNYLNIGNPELNIHHATIIPAGTLGTAQMNNEDNTEGGYLNSKMVKETLGTELKSDNTTILGKYIYPDFKNHIISYDNLLSTVVANDRSNQYGVLNGGASSGWLWEDRYLDLMSEVNVFGTVIVSSSYYDIGIDNQQYSIFKLKPNLINTDGNGNRFVYWLKAVADNQDFVGISMYGDISANPGLGAKRASESLSVRPRFLID